MGLFMPTDSGEILDGIMSELEAYCGPLPEGDERRIYGQALTALFVAAFHKVEDVAKQKMLKYARGEVLDALGDGYAERLQPIPAETLLRFSVPEIYARSITIPKGIRATTADGFMFATKTESVIESGNTYVDVEALAVEGGEDYNGITEGYINTIVDAGEIPQVVSVENLTVTSGGDDGEPDDEDGNERFRQRIRLAMSASSTAGPADAYRFYALSSDPRIVDAYVGTPSAGTVSIKVVLEGGELPTQEVNAKVFDACADDKTKPLTDLVQVSTPDQNTYSINLKYYVDSENEAVVEAAVDSIVEQYTKWQDEKFGRDINPDELVYRLMQAGAKRVTITAPTFTEVDADELAKFSGTVTITHEVTE